MRDYNKVTITGNVGRGREGTTGAVTVRQTSSGQSVAEFSVAVSRPVRDAVAPNGWRDETDWLTIIVWGEQGERLAESLDTGYRVLVEGRIQTRKWTDRDGHPRLSVEIIARDVLVLTNRADREHMAEKRAQIQRTGYRPMSANETIL